MPPHDPKPAAIPHDQGSPGAFGLPTHHPIFGSGWAPRGTQTSPRALQEEPHDLSRNTFRLVQPDREYAVGSAPASRSFVLAALRALHLDPRTTAPPPPRTGDDKANSQNDNGLPP